MSDQHAPWSHPSPPVHGQAPQEHPGEAAAPGSGPVHAAGRGLVPAGAAVRNAGPGPRAARRVLAYHRLAHADPHHAWWKPLVEGPLLIAFYLLFSVLFLIVFAVVFPGRLDVDDLLEMDQLDPVNFFFMFTSVALLLPSALLARLVMGPRPLGLLLSVTGRIRWGWLLKCALLALAIYLVVNGISAVLSLAAGARPEPLQPAPGFWWLLLLLVVIVPLQCASEELVFRGYLAQSVGRWLKHPAWAILLPVPLFVAGHVYDVWGLSSVGIMAVTMGIVTWRTGGLEAGIALHTVNNCFVTFLGMLGLADMNDTTGSPLDLVYELAINALFLAAVFRLTRGTGIAVTRTVLLPPPPQPPAPSARPAVLAEDRSGLAVHVVDPRSHDYFTLPPRYGPYTVRDARGNTVGILDVRSQHGYPPRDGGPSDGSSPDAPPSDPGPGGSDGERRPSRSS